MPATNLAGNYYFATAHPHPAWPALAGDAEADVCVVGGGVTGLSAALHAAQAGFSVVLLEAERIGFGASGRNGGQLIPGLRQGAPWLVQRHGRDEARRLLLIAREARELTLSLIERHEIDCDLRTTGHLSVAHRPSHLDGFHAEADCLHDLLRPSGVRVLNQDEAQHEVASSTVFGGLLDPEGGHLHPLNFTLGLAAAAARAGVRIAEQSRVTSIDPEGGFHATTAAGSVRARFGVIACDALLGRLDSRLAGFMMPIVGSVVATAPLEPALAASLIPNDRAVADTKFVVDYFRRTADHRLLFGGGESYTGRWPRDVGAFVRPYLSRVFPQLAQTPIEFGWAGYVSVTRSRMPHFGRRGEAWYAHGYSGQGALLSVLAGKLIAEAMQGSAERFDLLAGLAPDRFPGGTALRSPMYVAGMIWYALRDRLG